MAHYQMCIMIINTSPINCHTSVADATYEFGHVVESADGFISWHVGIAGSFWHVGIVGEAGSHRRALLALLIAAEKASYTKTSL